MTLILELTPEQEGHLHARAAQRGMNAAEYVLDLIRREPADKHKPLTGQEAIAFWERAGVLGLFADRPDSPTFARELRQRAESREW